ncbi:unannotated protein [freshwater metagenome]|uniref:Unannotated protein n=1 Tax=freshwater metagenome TaxID=449393 RepID=A0A6J7BR27_9ZZZZ|nr:Trm112 family protein [Actinomycetota bacterium]MSW37239.1 Trm112 family protein [Actinomycetota bacterium]MSX38055.1 Trm112 family protein [Actinomycetota bacterium]
MGELDPVMLELLACPCEQHAPVRAEGDPARVIVCTRCLTTFPVREGIPVMLLDDATPGPRGIGVEIGR